MNKRYKCRQINPNNNTNDKKNQKTGCYCCYFWSTYLREYIAFKWSLHSISHKNFIDETFNKQMEKNEEYVMSIINNIKTHINH